ARVDSLQELLQRLTKQYGPANDMVKKAKDGLDNAQTELNELKERLKPKLEGILRERMKAVAQARQAAEQQRLAIMESMKKLLTDEASRLVDETKSLTGKTVDLESYKEEIAQAEATAKKVQAEVENMSVELNAPTRVNMLDSALVVNNRDPAKQLRTA